MANIFWVKVDYGRNFHHLADHKTKLRNVIKVEIQVFSVSIFISINVCQNINQFNSLSDDFTHARTHAHTLDFSQNELEMILAKIKLRRDI